MKDYLKNSFIFSIIFFFSLCTVALFFTFKDPAYYPYGFVNYQDLAEKYNYDLIELEFDDYSTARFMNEDYTIDLDYRDDDIEVCILRNYISSDGMEAVTHRELIESYPITDHNLAPLVSALQRNAED